MKLHDLRPPRGAHHARKRVGRGIAAGGGKTAGRGTKGQKARAGAAIPAWFEGGQTPLQMRIPKLHGFKNRFRVEYEVVNLGRIAALVEAGIFEPGELPGAKKAGGSTTSTAPITINQEILRAAGLVSTLKKPLKVLGNGDLSVALFVVADSFSRSALAKIKAAGGSVQVLEVPSEPLAALGLDLEPAARPASSHEPGEPDERAAGERPEAQAAPVADASSAADPKSTANVPEAPAVAKSPAAKARAAKTADAKAKPAAKPAKVAVAKAKPAVKPAVKPVAKASKPAKATGKGATKTDNDA
jgi:large subunit ribosomal protein L15